MVKRSISYNGGQAMQKIAPCLWFDHQAEEVATQGMTARFRQTISW